MKKYFTFFILLISTVLLHSQETTNWELLYNGNYFSVDSVSEPTKYEFIRKYVYSNRIFTNLPELKNVDPQKFSDNFGYIQTESHNTYFKSLLRKDGYSYETFYNIMLTQDRGKTFKQIFSFNPGTGENLFNFKINTFIGFSNCNILNDSTILISGVIDEDSFDYGIDQSPYILKLTRKGMNDSLWDGEIIQLWRRTGSSISGMRMLNDSIGYAVFDDIFVTHTNQIIYTTDCWSNFKVIYQTENMPSPDLTNLQIVHGKDSNFVACLFQRDNIIILSHNNFKTYQSIDFINSKSITQLTLLDSTIYVLTREMITTSENKRYPQWNIHFSKNDGKTWDIIYTSSKGEEVNNFQMLDHNIWLLNGQFIIKDSLSWCSFLKTTDRGKSWEQIYSPERSRYLEWTNSKNPYYFINQDLILYCGNDKWLANNESITHFENPSYYTQFNSYFSSFLLNSNFTIYQTTLDKTLAPPVPKINQSRYNVYHAPVDTLFWDKIEGATKYYISYFGIDFGNLTGSISNDYLIESLYPTYIAQIDTVVQDTFLIINNLKRNYDYIFHVNAGNEFQKSITSVLRTNSETESIALPPWINYPKMQDTIPSGTVIIDWAKVYNADDYHFLLVDNSNYYYPMLNAIGKHYKGTQFRYDSLKPNTDYIFTICSSNDTEISKDNPILFHSSNEVSVTEIELNNIYLSPNPAVNTLKINNITEDGEYFEIYDFMGILILKGQTDGVIVIKELNPGVYFLKLKNRTPEKFLKL